MAQSKTARRVPARGRKIDKSTYRIYQGKEVKPVMVGIPKKNTTGYSTMMAGGIDGDLVRDSKGKIMPYKQIPNER